MTEAFSSVVASLWNNAPNVSLAIHRVHDSPNTGFRATKHKRRRQDRSHCPQKWLHPKGKSNDPKQSKAKHGFGVRPDSRYAPPSEREQHTSLLGSKYPNDRLALRGSCYEMIDLDRWLRTLSECGFGFPAFSWSPGSRRVWHAI